jgi:hypothetical protein
MEEKILPHTHFVSSETCVASEAPIDFRCKRDLEWVGVSHKAGSTFRLMMAAFYDVSQNGKFSYVHVYSIYHPDYQPKRKRQSFGKAAGWLLRVAFHFPTSHFGYCAVLNRRHSAVASR